MLSLDVITSKTVDDLEMGVWNDGTAFMSGRALSLFCGVAFSTLFVFAGEWSKDSNRPRDIKLNELLAAQGYFEDHIYFETMVNGTKVYAFPDKVCMAALEYYAYEAGKYCTEQAKNNFRKMARKTLRDFIYLMVGYDPAKQVPDSWGQYHDRLLLNPVPVGYFSVFKETADIVVSAIREGLAVDEHTVPDISVGLVWADFWRSNNLAKTYGDRVKFPHKFPDYFPQAKGNSKEANIYPIEALGEFRKWLHAVYLPEKFPKYIRGKAKQGALPVSSAELLIRAVEPPQLGA